MESTGSLHQVLDDDLALVSAAMAVLENQLTQNSLDIEALHTLRSRALADPLSFVDGMKRKRIGTVPPLQTIAAVPEIDMRKYMSPHMQAAHVADLGAQRNSDPPNDFPKRLEIFKSTHYSVFPDTNMPGDSTAVENPDPKVIPKPWSQEEKELFKALMEKYPPEPTIKERARKIAPEFPTRSLGTIATRLGSLAKKGDLFGDTLISSSDLSNPKALVHSSGTHYIGSHVAEMADSDSEVSDEDIDPHLKNSDEYMELMRLKSLLKIREREQVGSVSNTEVVHHNYACDSCGLDPIVGVRWKCKDCPADRQVDLCNECIQTDFQSGEHKLDHDFERVDKPEEQAMGQ
ncbi:hypothetical protein BC830DRAFT_1090888 [Chytriomyces sp. MP71]|nr:hypothetical protein BC830DRAFT_1090888 [Chytriomyces sp. MP71]